MVRRNALLAITTLALLTHAPAVYAAVGDPPVGSPAGAVYQLPLEQARSDAAPKGTGASGGGGATGGGSRDGGVTSLYRSENNFGSSSQVPGLPPGGGGGGPGTGAGGGAASGGAASGGDVSGGGSFTNAAAVTDAGNASVPGSIGLLIAIGLLATAIGVLSPPVARQAQ